jgi:hypothetical protein
MTFILTVVCLRPKRPPTSTSGSLLLRPIQEDHLSWARAGYMPGLAPYLGEPPDGAGFHVLVDDGGGYETSSVFVQYADDEDQPAQFVVPEEYRDPLDRILTDLMSASAAHRLVLVFEENGHVTRSDLTPEEIETIDILGPISVEAFWRLVDLGQALEDSVIVIDG